MCVIGRYLETGLLYLWSCPCPYPGFQPYRASAASSFGQDRAFSSQLQCRCKVNLLYVQDATRIPFIEWHEAEGKIIKVLANAVDEEMSCLEGTKVEGGCSCGYNPIH
jgi:hypothetical protein